MDACFSSSRRAFLGFAVAAALAGVQKSAAARELPNSLPGLRQRLDDLKLKGGGTIDLPAGDFLLRPDPGETTALLLPHGITLSGAGKNKTRLLMAPGVTGHVVNSYEGGATIRDLTIDGQSSLRPNDHGHNLRLEGDDNLIERVLIVNSCSYGIALAQRRYIRKSTIRDVDIVNSGADGMDLKNRLGKTEITIENVRVEGYGAAAFAKSNAGIDLRGKCTVRSVSIVVGRQLDGLRFRPGGPESSGGSGAHGSTASNIVITGQGSGTGVAVLARDVSLSGFDVKGATFGLRMGGAEGLRASNGTLSGREAALEQYPDRGVMSGVFEHVKFSGSLFARVKPEGRFTFLKCVFEDCGGDPKAVGGLTFEDSSFGERCR